MKPSRRCGVIQVVMGLLMIGWPTGAWTASDETTASQGADSTQAAPTEVPQEAAASSTEHAATPEAGGSETAIASPSTDNPAAASIPETPAASVATAPEASSTPGLISVDFKDADIRQVLRIISLKSGVDVVAGSDVEGLVTIKLTNVPWEQALDKIGRAHV